MSNLKMTNKVESIISVLDQFRDRSFHMDDDEFENYVNELRSAAKDDEAYSNGLRKVIACACISSADGQLFIDDRMMMELPDPTNLVEFRDQARRAQIIRVDGEEPVETTVEGAEFPMGLTVKELKNLVHSWPDRYENGEPTEVWMETGKNRSSPVKRVVPLNKRENGADIIFEAV